MLASASSSKPSNNIRRTALSSVSNSTPQQPKSTISQGLTGKANPQSQIKRTALSSKPSTGAQQRHLSSRNALVTPARKPNTKKALSVYTPAIPDQGRRGESDAVEYMPPRAKGQSGRSIPQGVTDADVRDIETPVNIHEELGLRSGADDDLIQARDTPPDLDFDLAPLESDQMCEQVSGTQMASPC